MNTRATSAAFFNLRLKLFVAALFCALALSLAPAPAHAAGLTDPQIDAVLQLLFVFDVPQETIDNVSAILHGQSEGQVPESSQAQAKPVARVHVPTEPVAYAPVPPQAPVAPAPGTGGNSLVAAAAMMPLSASAHSLNLIADQVIEVNYALAGVLSAYVELFSLDTIAQAAAATVAPMPAPAQEPRAGESVALTLAYLPQSLYETAGKTTDFLAAVEMAPLYVITDSLSEALFKAGLY